MDYEVRGINRGGIASPTPTQGKIRRRHLPAWAAPLLLHAGVGLEGVVGGWDAATELGVNFKKSISFPAAREGDG